MHICGKNFADIETNMTSRWESGTDHHPRSEELVRLMRALDEKNGDSLDIKLGGDGDNGETMMFLLDMIFEQESFNAEV